jgi:ATP-dependent Clp protease adapter protein ClpS
MAKRTKHTLYILNDKFNSFNDVITVLEMVMGFNMYQAEQIATIIHHKGRYPILKGDITELEEFEYILAKHGLTVEIK